MASGINYKIDLREFFLFSCNDNVNTSFISLTFSLKEININFTLNENDLWYKFEEKKYFLVLFQQYGNVWYLGKPFFKKFQIIFDQDYSIFGFYNNNIKTSSNFDLNWIIVLFLFLITLILILYIINYLMKKPRKKRINELIEDVDYTRNE